MSAVPLQAKALEALDQLPPAEMGSSIAMIDYHYGHLAHDSREHAVFLLDAALQRAVDAGWTPPGKPANPVSVTVSRRLPRRSRRTVVRLSRRRD